MYHHYCASLVLSLALIHVAALSGSAHTKRCHQKGKDPFPVAGENACTDWIWNHDLDTGSYLLSKPGYYCLAEDIEFNPNPVMATGDPWTAGDPKPPLLGTKYNPAFFGLGFFAAFVIDGSQITLDLRGHTIEQSVEHALQQRFYAHIELANSAFIPQTGPAPTSPLVPFRAARDVHITNGKLGRAAHHGIHGNDASRITLSHLTFADYEVAAISLNNVTGLNMFDCHGLNTRTDVPVMHTFSNARFLRPYLDHLENLAPATSLTVAGHKKDAAAIKRELKHAMHCVFEDIVVRGGHTVSRTRHPAEFALFGNPEGLPDGGAYGMLLNQRGPAIGDFPDLNDTRRNGQSRDVCLEQVSMDRTAAAAHIRPILIDNATGDLLQDPIGASMQVLLPHPADPYNFVALSADADVLDKVYTGNVLLNAQVFICKAAQQGHFLGSPLRTAGCRLTPQMLAFIENGAPLRTLGMFRCDMDAMIHINKGVLVYRFDGVVNLHADNISAASAVNTATGEKRIAPIYNAGLCQADPTIVQQDTGTDIFRSAQVVGIGISGSQDVTIESARLSDFRTQHGHGFGVYVQGSAANTTLRDIITDINPGHVRLRSAVYIE
jgi:hypothetical protein